MVTVTEALVAVVPAMSRAVAVSEYDPAATTGQLYWKGALVTVVI